MILYKYIFQEIQVYVDEKLDESYTPVSSLVDGYIGLCRN